MDVTRCKHAETGHEAELPTAALVAFKARGWEPISNSRTEQDAEQERIDAENAAALHVEAVLEVLTADKRPTVDAVLDEVGDDADAASAALAVEETHESPRTTLVARLNQIIDNAGDAGTTKEK